MSPPVDIICCWQRGIILAGSVEREDSAPEIVSRQGFL
jgi:hypothetical protein